MYHRTAPIATPPRHATHAKVRTNHRFYTHSQDMPTTNAHSAQAANTTIAPSVPAVELARVSRLYGSFVALREVSLTLLPGSSVVMLGENGAGKSTLLKLIAGLTSPSYGSISVFGDSPQNQRGSIAYMSHATMLYDELTGLENLTYFASLNIESPSRTVLEQTAADAMRQVGLDPALNSLRYRRVGDYSQGMRQRASLARVLLSNPDLLLLDEPFSNLDVGSAHSMIERLLAYVAQTGQNGIARTLLLTTHQAQLARPLAQSTLTLREGRFVSLTESLPQLVTSRPPKPTQHANSTPSASTTSYAPTRSILTTSPPSPSRTKSDFPPSRSSKPSSRALQTVNTSSRSYPVTPNSTSKSSPPPQAHAKSNSPPSKM